MKKLIVLGFLFSLNLIVFAQTKPFLASVDTIKIFHNSQRVSYYQNAELLDLRHIEKILSANNIALAQFSTYKDFNTAGMVLDISGAGLILYGFYSYTRSENIFPSGSYNPTPLLIGVGAVLVSFPVLMIGKCYLKNSILIYNNSIMHAEQKSVSMSIGVNANGVGLRMTF